MAASSIPVNRIDRKHQDWLTYNETWARCTILHEGGAVLKRSADQFLVKRPKEPSDVYQERKRRFTYQNVLGNAVGWYIAKMFQKQPQIDPKIKDQFYDDFLLDCDNGGMTFIDFFRSQLQSQILYGRGYVLIDKPRADDVPVSRADEKDKGLDRVYLCGYSPLQVINWSNDQYGNLNWVVIKVETDRQDAWDGPLSRVVTWYIFDRQNYYQYEVVGERREAADGSYEIYTPDGNKIGDEKVQARLTASGLHALAKQNRVPVRCIAVPDNLWLANRAYLHLIDHLNSENTLMWALFMANLAMMVIIGQEDLRQVVIAEAAYLHLTDKDAKVDWLEPKGQSFDISAKRLDGLREEVYRDFYLQAQARTSSATAQGASGYSKELDMAPANDVLNGFGDSLRASMQLVLGDVQEAHGDEQVTPDVTGFRFETKPLITEISSAQAMVDLGLFDKSPTLEREADKRVALSYLDDANDNTKNDVISEIENAPTRSEVKDQEQQDQAQAFEKAFQRNTATGVIKQEQAAAA